LKRVFEFRLGGCFHRRDTQKTQHGIETPKGIVYAEHEPGRDTQKTQHGIETGSVTPVSPLNDVETLRKPSTGLKQATRHVDEE